MIHIEISTEKMIEIKKLWCEWFFREAKIKEFIEILDDDAVFREMVFISNAQYNDWKLRFQSDTKSIKDATWRAVVCRYFFADLSDENKVVSQYKKSLQIETKNFLLKNYENYRLSTTLIKIINVMKVEVCPYCNRNFLENYSIKGHNNVRRRYFKGDLDHYYSKYEIPALALSFFNLIPCCKVCNHEKLETIKRTFFPFYDYEDKEYCFSIELYDDKDENDIIHDEPIRDVENKRFDSTVWQGVSDNFKIKLRGIDKTKLNTCMENSKDVFRLEKKYNHSKEYVKEIIRKKYIYSETHKELLMKNFGMIFKSETELLQTFFSYPNSEENLYNRPLSKLTEDVLKQLGISIK